MTSFPDKLSAVPRADQHLRLAWLLGASIIGVAFAYAFAPVMRVLVGQWLTNDTYSFGALVPLISGYVLWMQRHQLQALDVQPRPLEGTLLLVLCAAMLITGRMVGVVGVQEAAMVFTVPAMIWLLLGPQFMAALWFPLLYLLLMLPVWEILTDRFHYRFQLFSANLSESLVSLLGIPVHRNGTYLELPNITLEVASVCSGVNFLIAVIAIGVPQAYLFLKGMLPRAIVIGFAIAIALLSNGVRIAIIAALSHYRLSSDIHGPGHVLQGLFVSAAGVIALQLAIGYLSHRYPKPLRVPAVSTARTAASAGESQRVLLAATVAAIVLLVASVTRPQALVAASLRSTSEIPATPDGWTVAEANWPIDFVEGGPEEKRGTLFKTAGRSIAIYTGPLTYAEPAGGLGYRRVDIPSQSAWSEMPVSTSAGTIFVNSLSFRDGDQQTDFAFWYAANGTVTSQITTAKLKTLWYLLSNTKPLPQLVVVSNTQAIGTSVANRGGMDAVVRDVLQVMQARP